MNKKHVMISILLMMTVLSSCTTAPTCGEKPSIVMPDPLKIVKFPQKVLSCLTDEIKLNVVTNRVDCENRIKLLRDKLDNLNAEN